MELTTIDMSQEEARKAFEEYRHAIRSAKTALANTEDAQIMRCYKALANGRQVINLDDAMREAGEDDKGLPRLAISRADEARIRLERSWQSGNCDFFPASLGAAYTSHPYIGRVFRFRELLRSWNLNDVSFRQPSWSGQWTVPISLFVTIVPSVPPLLRPVHDLKGYHLLWEPSWTIDRALAPRDPALLKHLGGPLYAVLATWDLTPVEQAVLGVTRNER